MREIEIKVQVENLSDFKTYFESIGFVFDDVKVQDDIVFVDSGHVDVFGQSEKLSDATFVRVRTEKDIHTVTVKKRVSSELDCTEVSYKCETVNDVCTTLKVLGYVEVARVKKERIQSTLGTLTICLDAVEGLGFFVELEELCDDDVNAKEVLQRLEQRLDASSLKNLGSVHEGYDTLLYKKSGDSNYVSK